ncbi:unnamed protein product, partial [Coccothraustes coccothraustes]
VYPSHRRRQQTGLPPLHRAPARAVPGDPPPPPPPPPQPGWTRCPPVGAGPPRRLPVPNDPGAGVYRPSQTPHLPLSPERVAAGARRPLGARSESPPRGSPPRLTGRRPRRGAGPGTPPGDPPPREPLAAPAAAGAIHGKGPARVQSRRRARARAPRRPGGPRGAPSPARGASSSRGARPAPLRAPARPTQPLEPILIPNESSPDAAGTATLSKARAPLSGRTHSRAPGPSQRKENSPRGSRRLLRDRLRHRTGRLAAPVSATPDSGI